MTRNPEQLMKPILSAVLILLATAAFLPVRAQETGAAKAAAAAMQGEWSMVSGSQGGQSVPEEMRSQFKRVCKGNETTVSAGEQFFFKAKFTVDPTKNPATIDYQVLEGPAKGQKQLGIYELNGETIKFCFGAPGAERPTDFSTKAADGRTSSVWKRAKPSSPKPAAKPELPPDPKQ